MSINNVEIDATGYFSPQAPAFLFGLTLASPTGNLVTLEMRDGAGTALRMTLVTEKGVNSWRCGSPSGVYFANGIHGTVTGPGVRASAEYEVV